MNLWACRLIKVTCAQTWFEEVSLLVFFVCLEAWVLGTGFQYSSGFRGMDSHLQLV